MDLVTETDRRSEAIIVGQLRKHFPTHAIVAEEGSEGAAAGAKYCWYVDPLDGTTNFVHGYPCVGISIGLLEDGEPIAAAVMNPVAGELFTAAKGEGAQLNGEPMHVSSVKKLIREPRRHRFSHRSAQEKHQHGFLLGIHAALARRPPRRLRRA